MTYAEINELIEGIKLPYAYYQFPEGTGQAPPFICFYYPNRDDVFADNVNYKKKEVLAIELYTTIKDFETETAVESALTGAGFSFSKNSSRIDSESMWQITYETEVYIDG